MFKIEILATYITFIGYIFTLYSICMLRTGITFLFISLLFTLNAQIVINEASNRNFNQVYDEDDERNDWIELYNTGSVSVSLRGWALSENSKSCALGI